MNGPPSYSAGMAACQARAVEPQDVADGSLTTAALHLLCETACHNVLVPRYGPDDSSVGLRNDIWFWGDAGVGDNVHCEAVIAAADGRRIAFNVFARAGGLEIARGVHERMLVSRSRFLDRLSRRGS